MLERTRSSGTPPYTSYRTFKTFIEDLHEHGVPSRVDRSVLTRFSGVVGTQLMHALRFLGLIEDETRDQNPLASRLIRQHYKGTIIAAGGFDGVSANAIIESGNADLVAFGRHFIANPDLPARLQNGWPLNEYDRDSFFGGTEIGYTDYPFYAKAA